MRSILAYLVLTLLSFKTLGQTWPIHIEAERYDTAVGVSTEFCMEGGLNVTDIHAGDWVQYKINIPAASPFYLKVRTAGNGGLIQIRDSANNILDSIMVGATPTRQIFAWSAKRMRLRTGNKSYRFYFKTDGFNLKSIEVDTSNFRHVFTCSPITPFSGSTTWENTYEIGGWIKEINNARPAAATIVENPFGKKGYAFKFEQMKTDTPAAVRAEMRLSTTTDEPKEIWASWQEYLPSSDWGIPDQHQAVVGQFHEQPDFDLGENWRSPPIMRKIQNGRYYLNIMWAAAAVNTNNTKDGEITPDLGPILLDQWVSWVWHIKYAYDNTGIFELWRNGVKIYTRNNLPNSFNDKQPPYFKIGVYQGSFCCEPWVSQSPGQKRTVYIFNLKIGKPNSSYNEMKQ